MASQRQPTVHETVVDPWLLVQHISYLWFKECRGGEHAARRSHAAPAEPLPGDFFDTRRYADPDDKLPSHWISRRQHPSGFDESSGRHLYRPSAPIGEVRREADRNGVRLLLDEDYLVDRRRDRWGRSTKEIRLDAHEYGRIRYNRRCQHFDDVWYELHIINAVVLTSRTAPLDVFLREPDRTLDRMTHLP